MATPDNTHHASDETSTVFVRVASHRARHKLHLLVGDTPAYFSWAREGEWHLIPADMLDAAVEITGVSATRRTDDLQPCIRIGGGAVYGAQPKADA